MSEENKAVFLSYASQDTPAVERIADALRAAGVEVWFDKNELVGGDAWDAKIRGQIASCALFVPVISAATQARGEGYFRLEWKLAVDRSHLMAHDQPFLLPVVVDATPDAAARVPPEFRAVQWTRLPGGETPAKFCARVGKLLGGDPAGPIGGRAPGSDVGASLDGARGRGRAAPRPKSSRSWLVPAILGGAVLVALALWQPWKNSAPSRLLQPPAPAPVARTPAQALVSKAQAIVDQGDELNRETYALAEELLVKAEQLDVSEASAWILHAEVSSALIGYALDDSTTRREALRAQANRAVQLAPASLAAQLVECDSLIAFGQNVPGIVEKLQALAAKHRENWRVFDLLSEGFRLEGKFTEGLAANARARQLAPDNFLVKGNRLSLFSRAGDWAAAEKELAGMMQGRTSARMLAFDVLLKLVWRGDPAGAVAAVQGWPAWFLLEDRGVVHAVYAALWNRNPALALQFVQKYPRDYIRDYMFTGPTAVLSAWANEQAGNLETARADWRVVQQVAERELRANPNETYALHWKAWSLARLGDTASAAPVLQQLVEGNSSMRNMARVLGRFGALALNLGRSDLALGQIAKEPRVTTKSILRLNPVFDRLREDSRFQALIESAPGPQESKPVGAVASKFDEKSVAVLAFANLSDDKGNEYFSDGISEELLNVLAKIPGLKVSARTSAYYFKGRQVPMAEIAKQLGVAYVVEGSVRKQGDKVRITAQLIKASDGFHAWSDTFTRDLKDIFAVQDEIAGLIAKNLQLKMGLTAARPTIDVEAYQEYLAGRSAPAKDGMADLREAVAHLERAVAIEPKFTAAWVQLAGAHTKLGRWGGTPTLQAWPSARAAIAKAQDLEPDSPDVLLALGWIRRTADWDWRGAEQAFRRTLQLQPNQPDALTGAAVLLFNLGRTEEAFRLSQQAARLDPLNASTQVDLSLMFYFNKNWAESERAARRALQLAPGGNYHGILSWSLSKQKRYPEAEAEARLENDELEQAVALSILALARGQEGVIRDCRTRLEAIARKRGDDTADLQQAFAWIHAALGDKDRAFAALEKARASRDPSMAWLRNEDSLAPLFSDPRWDALLRQMGLTDDQLK
ncbi:MAG: TIR domain-containing protein [Undibacterium sp.]|nr:TIR domain-containing protein [Opitutaceae bacterium]